MTDWPEVAAILPAVGQTGQDSNQCVNCGHTRTPESCLSLQQSVAHPRYGRMISIPDSKDPEINFNYSSTLHFHIKCGIDVDVRFFAVYIFEKQG